MTITPLKPFGVKLGALPGQKITSIAPRELDALLKEEKLVLLRGFTELERDEFLAYCKGFAERRILEWDFGPVMELRESPDPKNYLFSRERVPFHWDGAFHQVPTYLAFSCIEAPVEGAGGETLFTNTESIWEKSSEAEKNFYAGIELTFETRKLAHYGGKITGPLVQSHPESGKPILRFAEAVSTELNPVTLEVSGIVENERDEFVTGLTRKVYDPSFCLAHTWQKGDFLFADNHSLIHGRRAFEKDCPRHLRRVQIV